MSGSELTMDEKYFDLQNKLIETKLSSIASTLENFGKDVKKVLDDHELRLREQAKAANINSQEIVTQNTINAQEILTLKNEQRELKQELVYLRAETAKRTETFEKEQDDRTKRELTLWQSIGVEAIKFAAFGAGSGGVIAGILKLFGSV